MYSYEFESQFRYEIGQAFRKVTRAGGNSHCMHRVYNTYS